MDGDTEGSSGGVDMMARYSTSLDPLDPREAHTMIGKKIKNCKCRADKKCQQTMINIAY